jgi:hypothetical protein
MRGYLTLSRLAAVVAFLLLIVTTAGAAVAKNPTPTLSGAKTSWVGSPPPSDCTVEPLTVDAIVDAVSAPVAAEEDAFPLTVPSETDLPKGTPADDAAVDAASARLWEAVACINGGDAGGFFACFSPEGIRALFIGILGVMGRASGPLTEQELTDLEANFTAALAVTPEALAEEDWARIASIRDARMLPDKRLLLLVDGTLGEEATVYAVFRLVEEQWLIDAFGQIGIFPTPAAE